MKFKGTPLSLEEKVLISKNRNKTPLEVAIMLNRNPRFIKSYMTSAKYYTPPDKKQLTNEAFINLSCSYLRIEVIAELLGISKSTVQRIIIANNFKINKPLDKRVKRKLLNLFK